MLDLRTCHVGHKAVSGLSQMSELMALCTAFAFRDDVHKVGRALVDRCLKDAGRRARSLDQRLVVACEKSRRDGLINALGAKMRFKKSAGRHACELLLAFGIKNGELADVGQRLRRSRSSGPADRFGCG